ncbi:MAG: hypothetical protein NT007_15395 [Candidatus Kapabacteria bacterium]|nr:hypothetical protein [Candidatus Kapabacteria bacterium]
MKKFFSITIVALFLSLSSSFTATGNGFQKDNLYIGPTVGYNYYFASGTLGFGARGEYGLMDKVDVGTFKGSIGLGAELFYSSYKYEWGGYWDKWSYTSFLIFAAFHFQPKEAFDPYVRAGLGFANVSYTSSWTGTYGGSGYNYGSGLDYTASIGFNYRFSNSMSFRADLGYPVLLSAGIDFNLGKMAWQK